MESSEVLKKHLRLFEEGTMFTLQIFYLPVISSKTYSASTRKNEIHILIGLLEFDLLHLVPALVISVHINMLSSA